MKSLRTLCLAIAVITLAIACQKKDSNSPTKQQTAYNTEAPYLIVVSLDGFRWDYADHLSTPNLDYIAANGVKAESLIPSFPTITFPNHYTLATGLYPDHHGLIYNRFYDPKLDKRYSPADRSAVEDPRFYGGEPMWNTAEKQGVKAAAFYWPGSEAPVNGRYASIWKKYDHTFPFEQRVDSVISWLNLPEAKRPHLVNAYFPEPDGHGHAFGPDAQETKDQVEEMDRIVGLLIQKIQTLPIANKVNLIVLSDHGMCGISKDRWVVLNEKVKESWVEHVNSNNPVLSLVAKEGCQDSIFNALSEFEHIKYWAPKDIPARLNFGSNYRIGDVVVLADSAWSVDYDNKSVPKSGTHGFDNANTDMHAIFYAMGPAFKKGYTQPTFKNVSIYPLVSKILNITPAPNDGNIQEVEGMLNH